MENSELIIASVGRRIFGGIFDLVLLFIFSIFFGNITGLADKPINGYGVFLGEWPFLLSMLVCFLLFSLIEYFTGKTPGKYLARTRVISEDGKRIHIWQALVRNVARFVDIFGLYLLGLIIILLNKKRQRFGDFLAKTYVIRNTK